MTMFRVRRYLPADHDAVWELHNLALNQVGAHAGNGPWDDDLHHIEEDYLRNNGEFLVGVLDDRIVAMGALKYVDRERAKIMRMRVHPDHQRKGHGRAILQALEQRALEFGYRTLFLDTTTVQKGAQAFYTQNGYVQVGHDRYDTFDLLLYEKRLPVPRSPSP